MLSFRQVTNLPENPMSISEALLPEFDQEMANTRKVLACLPEEIPEYKPHEIANGPGMLTLRKDGFGLSIDAVMANDGWVVASQSAWKGWRAYVDGKRVEMKYANHAFLGLFVPAGRHHIRLMYLPDSFTRGRAISFATLALLIVIPLTRSAIRARGRQRRPSE